MTLNPNQFASPADVPAEFGTTPIPEGHVRFSHYTSPGAEESIRREGLLMSKAHESYARGGTEYPSIFATAGVPSADALRNRPHIEGHISAKDLDVGMWSEPHHLEASHATITTNKNVPPENIIAVHQPWHSTYRYLVNEGGRPAYKGEPAMSGVAQVMGGEFDNFYKDQGADEPGTEANQLSKAISAVKVLGAATAMVGGKL